MTDSTNIETANWTDLDQISSIGISDTNDLKGVNTMTCTTIDTTTVQSDKISTADITCTGTMYAEGLKISQGIYGSLVKGLYFGLLNCTNPTDGQTSGTDPRHYQYFSSTSTSTTAYTGQICFNSVFNDSNTLVFLCPFGGVNYPAPTWDYNQTKTNYGVYGWTVTSVQAGTYDPNYDTLTTGKDASWHQNTATNGVYTYRIKFNVAVSVNAPSIPSYIYWLAVQT